MSMERVLDLMTTLTLTEAVDVDLALHRYIALLESWARPAPDVVEQLSTAGGCYRRELVKCGKAKCKCAEGKLHGPYWYHYSYKPGGGQRKRYIGKELPAGVSTLHSPSPSSRRRDKAQPSPLSRS